MNVELAVALVEDAFAGAYRTKCLTERSPDHPMLLGMYRVWSESLAVTGPTRRSLPEAAVDVCENALLESTRERVSLDWAMTKNKSRHPPSWR